jgi:hypothetical protein
MLLLPLLGRITLWANAFGVERQTERLRMNGLKMKKKQQKII